MSDKVKAYNRIQDLSLAKSSLKKVLLHISQRGNRSVLPWIREEISFTIDRLVRDQRYSEDANKLDGCVRSGDFTCISLTCSSLIKGIDQEITELYSKISQ